LTKLIQQYFQKINLFCTLQLTAIKTNLQFLSLKILKL